MKYNAVIFTFTAAATLFAETGCGPELLYLPSLAAGQFEAVAKSVPIETAINRGTLSEQDTAKLKLILNARTFATDTIGLSAGSSFERFVDTNRLARAINLSASAKDKFQPVMWTFPIVGTVPYLMFFNEAMADRRVHRLEAKNMDVLTYDVDAYSTLSFLPNPVRSAMLKRDDITIVEIVIHELLHETVFKSGDTTFNESLATFVGRTGSVDYFRRERPDAPDIAATAIANAQDTDRYNTFIFDLYSELDAFYASDMTSQQKIAGREQIFQSARDRFTAKVLPLMNSPQRFDWVADLPTNNAWMLANYRYNLDLDVFQKIHDATGGDWELSLGVFRQAARANDPWSFMNAWLATQSQQTTPAEVVTR